MKLTTKEITKAQELQQKLIEKAWSDAQFKEELINSPSKAISKFTDGLVSLEASNIVVEDQSNEDTIYLNIPPKVDLENFELSDEQLEAVSGGEDTSIFYDIGYTSMTINITTLKAIYNWATN